MFSIITALSTPTLAFVAAPIGSRAFHTRIDAVVMKEQAAKAAMLSSWGEEPSWKLSSGALETMTDTLAAEVDAAASQTAPAPVSGYSSEEAAKTAMLKSWEKNKPNWAAKGFTSEEEAKAAMLASWDKMKAFWTTTDKDVEAEESKAEIVGTVVPTVTSEDEAKAAMLASWAALRA